MENRLGWLLLRWLLYVWRFLVVLVLTVGISVGAGSIPAHAYCVGSSLCNPANAPIIAELAGAGGAPVGAAATATGSTITAPLATGVGTTAGGSTIAAEVWGGLAGVALSAAGWLGAKAFLGDGDIPDPAELPPAIGEFSDRCGKETSPGSGVYTYGVGNNCLPWGPLPSVTFSGQTVTWSIGSTGSIQRTVQVICYATTQQPQNVQPSGALIGGQNTLETATSGSATCNPGLVPGLKIWENGKRTGYTDKAAGFVYLNVPTVPTPAEVVMYLETRLDCTGGTTHSYSSDYFSEVPTNGVVLPERLCPNGQKVTRTRVWLRVVDMPSMDKLLADVSVPEYLQQLVPNACVTAGTDDCSLDLQKDGQSIVGDQTQADWEIKAGAEPHRYRCLFGGMAVDLRFCRAVYGAQPRMSEPVTETEPVPAPGTTPYPYPETAPDWPPLGDPLPPTPGTDEGSCIRWSLASVLSGEVMFQAVGCALEWAFVPDPATLTATAAVMQASWYTSGPVLFMSEGSGIISSTSDNIGQVMSGNCQGPAINLPNYDEPLYLLNACDPPVSTVAGWTHLGSAFVFAFFGLVGALRVVLAAFNIHLPWSKSTAEEGASV